MNVNSKEVVLRALLRSDEQPRGNREGGWEHGSILPGELWLPSKPNRNGTETN